MTDEIIELHAEAYDREYGMDNSDYGDPLPWEEDSNWGHSRKRRRTSHSSGDSNSCSLKSSTESTEYDSES